jgi:hypothetical protein
MGARMLRRRRDRHRSSGGLPTTSLPTSGPLILGHWLDAPPGKLLKQRAFPLALPSCGEVVAKPLCPGLAQGHGKVVN